MAPPELTPLLRQRLVDGCISEAAGRSIQELERERDESLIVIMEALEKYRNGK
jgi:carnitine 3-dehydrogenase